MIKRLREDGHLQMIVVCTIAWLLGMYVNQ